MFKHENFHCSGRMFLNNRVTRGGSSLIRPIKSGFVGGNLRTDHVRDTAFCEVEYFLLSDLSTNGRGRG